MDIVDLSDRTITLCTTYMWKKLLKTLFWVWANRSYLNPSKWKLEKKVVVVGEEEEEEEEEEEA